MVLIREHVELSVRPVGKVKSQWLEHLSEVLQLSEQELMKFTLKELDMMLAEYEQALVNKLKETDDYINAQGWDVDVDEDGPFIVSTEGGIT